MPFVVSMRTRYILAAGCDHSESCGSCSARERSLGRDRLRSRCKHRRKRNENRQKDKSSHIQTQLERLEADSHFDPSHLPDRRPLGMYPDHLRIFDVIFREQTDAVGQQTAR